MARKMSDKNADMDYHAVLPPEYQAGGDSKRENLCRQDSGRVNKTTLGPSSSGRPITTEILQVHRPNIDGESTSGSSAILQRILSRRARRNTNFTIKY